MKFSDIPLNPTPRMLRQFAGGWLVMCLGLAVHRRFFEHDGRMAAILLGVSVIGVLGLWLPRSVRWLFIGISVVTFPIGVVMANVFMAAMYFLILTPIGLSMRLSGRDVLQRKRREESSCWRDCRGGRDPNRYLKQF